jgi:hypothetical protein
MLLNFRSELQALVVIKSSIRIASAGANTSAHADAALPLSAGDTEDRRKASEVAEIW